MAFRPGQRVRAKRLLQMRDFAIPAGSLGTVADVHLQTSVLFDEFDHQLTVPDGDIELLGPAAPDAVPRLSPADQTAGFNPGARVRLLVTKNVGGTTIPAGTQGTVTQDAPSMAASWVLFDGFHNDVLIPNEDLASG